MKVVIVEDEIRIREGLIGLLKRFYRNITSIEEACDGQQGLAVIRKTKPDLVITDIRMEPMDGLEMLRILREEGLEFKTVILSAFAEFEYAKRAVTLGAVEYLVKPIDITELRAVMQTIQAQLAQEKLSRLDNPEKLRSLDNILHGFATGALKADAEIHYFLKNTYDIPVDDPVGVVSGYMGRFYEQDAQTAAGFLGTYLQNAGYCDFEILQFPERQELVAIVHGKIETKRFTYVLQEIFQKLRDISGIKMVLAVGRAEGLNEIHEQLLRLRALWPWCMAHSDGSILTRETLENTEIQELVYPLYLEKRARQALCEKDYETLNANAGELMDTLCRPCYDPVDIKNALAKFLWAIIHTMEELHAPGFHSLDPARTMERVTTAYTRRSLEEELDALLHLAADAPDKAVSKLVGKVESLVEQYYAQGITLEEIASILNLSPDHISAQFVKEHGVNFSTYMRSYRLGKAKSLLLGTDMKVYEISQKVGYTDAKYFSRVFRDTEGMLPAEYRKRHAKGI